MPKYYYVTRDHIDAERRAPHSQIRLPSVQGQGNNIFLWGQALYIIACLLSKSEQEIAGGFACFVCLMCHKDL